MSRPAFIQTMVRDSHGLERQNEPGQAFDKLARAIESVIGEGDPGHGHRRKARDFFAEAVADEAVWAALVRSQPGVSNFAEELSYYVGDPQGAKKLRQHSEAFASAVTGGDRERGASALADLYLTLRNSRAHGSPGFSGQNVRIAHHAPALLAGLRAVLDRHATGE